MAKGKASKGKASKGKVKRKMKKKTNMETEYEDVTYKIFDIISEYYNKKIESVVKDPYVRYSAFHIDNGFKMINDIDDVAMKGKVKFYHKYDSFWDKSGKGKDYESKMITNPTWLDVCVMADEMIRTTCDMHHIFLEDIEKKGNKVYFVMGS